MFHDSTERNGKNTQQPLYDWNQFCQSALPRLWKGTLNIVNKKAFFLNRQ